MISLPKVDMDALPLPDGDDPSEDEPLSEEEFQHDFNLAAILSNVRESPYTYADAIIRDFHLNLVSIEDKNFVILNGNSGTGKTRLCLLYANAVYGRTYDAANPYLQVIPVRPDWTDSTSLFGYYSALDKRYVRTPFLKGKENAHLFGDIDSSIAWGRSVWDRGMPVRSWRESCWGCFVEVDVGRFQRSN